MAKNFKKALSALLAGTMVMSSAAGLVSATESKETVWRGDTIQTVVEPGHDAYTFMGHYGSPAHSYEISHHFVVADGYAKQQTQLFMMLTAEDQTYTWTPDGLYTADGTNNYDLVYCCDVDTGYEHGAYYKRTNLEDSTYFEDGNAEHIRAIITNSYPAVSIEQMKKNLAADGFEYAADLTRSDIITAVQSAVWYYANGGEFYYDGTYDVTNTPKWGIPAHDHTNEMEVWWNTKSRAFSTNEEVEARINALIDYLKGLDKVEASNDQVVVSNLQINRVLSSDSEDGSYTANLIVELNNGGNHENDNIVITVTVGDNTYTREVLPDTTEYLFEILASHDDKITATVSGTQILPTGAYFYEPEGGRGTSQSMVGVAMGETKVYSKAETTFSPKSIDKYNDGLDKDLYTNVTLKVPGNFEGYVDVVFILGGGMTANMETIESAIDVFKPSMESGKATVRMGLISLEKGKEIILDLNSDEAVLDPDTYVDFVTEKFESLNDLPYGTTNLHSQMLEAQAMLAAEPNARPENKYVFVLATGRTYWFDDANGEQATIVGKTIQLANGAGGTENFYYYGNYTWQSLRGKHSSLYMIPDKYNDNYAAFFADIEKWVEADGDKYVYTPHFDVTDYSAYQTWYNKNSKDWRDLYNGGTGTRYGAVIIDPKPAAENFSTGEVSGIPYGENNHAMNYERAQYECVQVWKELIDAGYRCYSICSENPNYQNNSEYIKQGAKYTGTSTTQVGHSFMNYLAELAGQGEAPTVWDYERDENGNLLSAKPVLQENFFEPIREDLLYTCSVGSYVEDYIGYEEGKGNFEFVTDPSLISMTVGDIEYITTQVETNEGYEFSLSFTAPGADEPTFWLDYTYGNGKTTEMFTWTFGENISKYNPAALTYKLQLIDTPATPYDIIIDTNLSATLYPKNSNQEELPVEEFPVPAVWHRVEATPYDVDIVLALGAGIAQYDADSTKGTNTYDSILALVEPLLNDGVNVKLGLVAVEHYDDVAMPLTALTLDNYKDVITGGLDAIQSMPAGPTNLHGNIVAAKEMLDADSDVPAENKFFYVIATGRTYNFDNADGVPTTIINKVALKGSTYYYWGHYLWQSQRGGHTSLYMIPARYNNDFTAYWADVCKWVEADGDTYAYSFNDYYDVSDPQWFNTFFAANKSDAKALKLASSRFGWILGDLTNSGLEAIGSGSNPQNALNYERAQYEAWVAYNAMEEAGYNCYALCSENTSYQNGSPYIQIAKYTGTSTIQLGHSFMNFLAGEDQGFVAPLLFVMTDPTTGASEMAKDFFAAIDTDSLVEGGQAPVETPSITITNELPEEIVVAIGEKFAITVEAEGEGLTYQWYYKNKSGSEFVPSSFTGKSYAMTMASYCHMRQVYCVITDAYGNTVTTDTVTIKRPAVELEILTQPQNVEVAIGEKFAITVEAVGDGLTYQWYYKNKSGSEFVLSSFTGKSYAMTMASYCHMRQVYCVITDAYGNTATTEIATITRPAIALEILTQPQDVTAAAGEKVIITVEAQGEGLTYQWYYKNKNGTAFSASSYKGKSYSMNMANYCDMRQVYCVITDQYGNTVTSDIATMTLAK